jgi:hypothetical protein
MSLPRNLSPQCSSRAPSLLPTLMSSLVGLCIAAGECSAQLSTVATAASGETVQGVLSGQQGLARTADGRLWSLSYYNDGKAQGAQSQFSRIHVSADNGKTWTLATTLQAPAVRGSMRTGIDGRTLHVVWQSNISTSTSSSYYSVLYHSYDSVSGAWNGSPSTVAQGVNANNQYQSPDIVVTESGTIVVGYNGHRQSPSWSGRMRVLRGTTWSAEQRVNVDTYGIQLDMQAHGEDVYFAYRTSSGGYGIRCRRYQCDLDQWGAEGEMQVSQANTTNTNPASSGNGICVTPAGDVYVIYAKGASSPGNGEIWVGMAPAGTFTFSTHVKIDDDAQMLGGNKTYYHYALARSGQRVNVLYSKLSENFNKLYMRWLIAGQVFPPIAVPQASGANAEFQFVSAHRDPLGEHGMMAQLTDRGTPTRAQALVMPVGSSLMHRAGCSGNLKQQPRQWPASAPSLGSTLNLDYSQLPASSAGLLIFGLQTQSWGGLPLPLPLDALGMPGCALAQDYFLSAPFASDANGDAKLAFPIPAISGLSGVPLLFQGFILAPGANSTGAVMTNGSAAIAF